MKNALLALLALSCVPFCAGDSASPDIAVPASGPDAPASKATVEELLAITNARALVQNISAQMNRFMQAAMPKTINGHALTPDEQARLDKVISKLTDIYRDELSWDKLEPMYIEVYQRSFTESELEGTVAFYKTPAGQAFLKKIPVVMQNTMSAMQSRMGPIAERISKAIEETKSELQKADSGTPATQGK